ncbi:hypothetical protein SAMN02745866_04357 [Alteromonadaceae bacterium Bs31]|nr:hypothetical protein SAMN02745866_04357 [Alteromonadaceae bacterium Bs31]
MELDLKKLIILLACFYIVSCGSASIKDNIDTPLLQGAAGAWTGKISQFTTKELPDSQEGEMFEVVFLNCNNNPEIWMKFGDDDYRKIYEDYLVISNAGNHLFNKIIDGDGWVETQSWAVSAIDDERAAIQWNRMVSNPALDSDHNLRIFGQMGYGELTRISSSCDIWVDNANK